MYKLTNLAGGTLQSMNKHANGFTIVEPLIVIVVVAVLATLSYVGYTNISNRAHDSAVQADLRQFGQTISLRYAELGAYSGSLSQLIPYGGFQAARESYATSFTGSDTGNYLYCFNNITQQFGLVARSRSGSYFQYRDGSVSPYTGQVTTGVATMCPNIGVEYQSRVWIYSADAWQF